MASKIIKGAWQMYQLGMEARDYIFKNIDRLTENVITCQAKIQPDLRERYGEQGYSYYCRDIKHHFRFLGNALNYLSKGLFNSYIEWVNGLLSDLNVPTDDVIINFQCFKRVFENQAPENLRSLLVEFIDAGLTQFDEPTVEIPSFIDAALPLSELATDYLNSLLQGDQATATQLIQKAIKKGIDIRDIYLQVLEKVQLEIGRLWQTNQLDVAEEHFSTSVTGLVMAQLYPHIEKSSQPKRTLVAACVSGELHDLGIRIVSDFFELCGWNSYFVGANTPTPSILHAVAKQNADLLALSATIPLHIVEVEKVISVVRKTNNIKDLKIVVGGRAFMIDQELWRKIGADGYAPDARAALDIVKELFRK